MTVKLSRYIFRKIGGRIIPIRKGVESLTDSTNFYLSILRKMDALINKKNAEKVAKFVDGSSIKDMVYHGTNATFKKFSHDKIGSSVGTSLGRGFYFTNKKDFAKGYGSKIKEYFLSIKNPLMGSLNDGFKTNNLKNSEIEKIIKGQDLSNWGEKITSKSVAENIQKYNTNDLDKIQDIGTSVFHHDWKKALSKVRKVTGIDGAIAGNEKITNYVAFNSDQIMSAPKKSKLYDKALKLRNRTKK